LSGQSNLSQILHNRENERTRNHYPGSAISPLGEPQGLRAPIIALTWKKFLILHIALSGRFSFGSRHGLSPSGPRAANLVLIAFWYRDFLPTRHSASNECAQSRLIPHKLPYLSQFHMSTPYIPLDHCPTNLKEVYIGSDRKHSKSSRDMVSIYHHCRFYTPLVL
jgi:hypothetical protein